MTAAAGIEDVLAAEPRVQFQRNSSSLLFVSYCYRAYGLGIHSTVSIPGLVPCGAGGHKPDVRFETGQEPAWVRRSTRWPGRVLSYRPGAVRTGDPAFTLTAFSDPHGFELSYSDGTRFVVGSQGRKVWGTFRAPLTVEDLATYFLGPIMGFLLLQRRLTSLHASAVEVAGHAVAFTGYAGAGKSTTAAALALRGVPVLSEDIVPLRENAGKVWAIPGYPRVCLWPDVVAYLGGTEEALPRLTPTWEKRYLPLDGVRGTFATLPRPLGLIYLFGERSSTGVVPRIEEIRPRNALLELVQNTYMNWLPDREQRAVEFEHLGKIVTGVPVRRIVPHIDPRRIAALCELILADSEAFLKTC